MSNDDLRTLITHLHQEIESLPPTAEGRARLSELATQLEAKLEDEEHDLVDRVAEAVDKWEADHPKATALLNRISTLLSGAGL